MFELLTVVIFFWLMFQVIGLIVKVAWGAAKLVAGVLLFLALPVLIGVFLFAGGIALLIPVAMIAIAAGILKACL